MNREQFSKALKAERARLGLTQNELAKLLDVSFEAVSKWERGKSEPFAIAQEGAMARLKKVKQNDSSRSGTIGA